MMPFFTFTQPSLSSSYPFPFTSSSHPSGVYLASSLVLKTKVFFKLFDVMPLWVFLCMVSLTLNRWRTQTSRLRNEVVHPTSKLDPLPPYVFALSPFPSCVSLSPLSRMGSCCPPFMDLSSSALLGVPFGPCAFSFPFDKCLYSWNTEQ